MIAVLGSMIRSTGVVGVVVVEDAAMSDDCGGYVKVPHPSRNEQFEMGTRRGTSTKPYKFIGFPEGTPTDFKQSLKPFGRESW